MSDVITLFVIGGELVFLVYAINWLAKELKRWKSN